MDLSPRKTGEIVLRKKVHIFHNSLLPNEDRPTTFALFPPPSLPSLRHFLPSSCHRLHFNFANCLLRPTPLLFLPSPLSSYFCFRRREKEDFPPLPLYHLCLRRRPFCTINPTPPTARRRRRQFSTWRDQVSFAYRSVFIHSEKKHRTGEKGRAGDRGGGDNG